MMKFIYRYKSNIYFAVPRKYVFMFSFTAKTTFLVSVVKSGTANLYILPYVNISHIRPTFR